MSQLLYVMRHGNALNPPGIHDFDRELSDRGRMEVRKVAKWLSENHDQPKLTLVSPLIRAQQTFEEFQSQFGEPFAKQNTNSLIYTSPAPSLSVEVSAYSESPILLIGHQPLLSDFVGHISNGKISVDFPTSAIVCIHLKTDEDKIKSTFEWQINPAML